MNKTTVIYHSADFDGLFCREIARKFLPEAELIGWNFGDPLIPFPEGKLYILDLAFQCIQASSLTDGWKERCIWIDHHKTSMEEWNKDVAGYRIDGVAACRLAWQWFDKQSLEEPDRVPLPEKQDFVDRVVREPFAVRLAGEYDIWDKRDPDAELFQHGLRSQELTTQTWSMMLDPTVEKSLEGTGMEITNSQLICSSLLNQGRCLQYSKEHENASIIKAAGFDLDWEGLHFLAVNHARYNSLLFTAGLKPEHDACYGFAYKNGQWTVSLYHAPGKEHHDLSKIAVKYGGGGHKGACGFQTKTLPFLS